jgi:uncharacterized protein (DUF4213/DUF364 family)
MSILDDLLSSLELDAPVRDIRLGLFHTGVLTRHCGLASTLPRDALKQRPLFAPLVQEAGFLLERSAEELTRLAYSENLPEATIGMATVNSLIDVPKERCVVLNAGDLIAEKGKDKNVAIVGHFPFVPKLREIAAELWVIEKNPEEGDLEEDSADEFLPRADVVGITGATLTNHTFDHVVGLCRTDAYVVLLGDSTPLSPVLFDHGVDAVSGTNVIDPDLALACVSQGATFRQVKGRQLLTMTKQT